MRKSFRWVAVVLCLQGGWCTLSCADSYTTNIISGVSTNTGTYFILGDTGSMNYLLISNGGSLGCVYATIGNNPPASSNTALVTGTNSVWTATGGFFVGEESAGNSLIVSNGGQLISTSLSDLGDGNGASNNVVILTGTNSAWSNNGSLIIGYQGSGNQLLVLNGAQLLSSNFLWLGTELTANNALVVDGLHSRVSSSGSFEVGAGGPGNQFTLSGGASFVCAWAQVSGPGNVITISGSNTVWNNHGSLDFGYCCGGSNQLTISAGAVVSNTAVLIGDSIVASNNVVLVAGSNSLWQVNGYFYVTTSGNMITVTNQARVNSSSLTIDNAAPLSQDRSILTVADGSVWSNSGTLDIGYNGAGNELDVEGGSRVMGNTSIILGNSNSVLNISGANSLLSSSGTLIIGQFGGGDHVTISNGAALVTSGGTSIGPGNIAGSTITLTGIGSVWTNGFQIYMSSPNNLISITDGAYLNSGGLLIGNAASGNSVLVGGPGTRMDAGIDIGSCGYTNNSLVVSNGAAVNGDLVLECAGQMTMTGTNTIWSDSGTLYVNGNDQLSILDGAQFLGNQFVYVGGSGNDIVAAGNNARWGKIGQLYFGQSAASNSLTIGAGGSVDAQQMFIGTGNSGPGQSRDRGRGADGYQWRHRPDSTPARTNYSPAERRHDGSAEHFHGGSDYRLRHDDRKYQQLRNIGGYMPRRNAHTRWHRDEQRQHRRHQWRGFRIPRPRREQRHNRSRQWVRPFPRWLSQQGCLSRRRHRAGDAGIELQWRRHGDQFRKCQRQDLHGGVYGWIDADQLGGAIRRDYGNRAARCNSPIPAPSV